VIRFSETAANDLESIYDFIARNNPDAALATVKKLLDVMKRLGEFPNMGRKSDLGTRELVISPFVIIYRIVDDVINIEAVFHGSRRA
jgi:toxin ParE1/3/4